MTKHNNKLIKLASYASVLTAIVIMLTKTYGWLITESQSILASLIDSMLDISSSIINLIAIRFSLVPPDDNHRFGHEKFQDLAIYSQSIFFVASGLFTLFSCIKSLVFHEHSVNSELGAGAMYICVFLTLILVCFQTYVIKKTDSKIISADKLHYFSDLISNVAVIISIYTSVMFWYTDAMVGIAISLYILYGSYKLFRSAISNLADEEFHPNDRAKILEILTKSGHAKGVHELKTRYAANKPFIQFHLELDGDLKLLEAHEISDDIMAMLLKEFPDAEVTIHQDPAGVEKNVNYREKI